MLLDYKKIKKIKPSACTVQPTSADDDKTPCFFVKYLIANQVLSGFYVRTAVRGFVEHVLEGQ